VLLLLAGGLLLRSTGAEDRLEALPSDRLT
jgi:hypothetical protein